MKKVPITCSGCGKLYEIEVKDLGKVDEHTFVAKCDCGATTQYTGDGAHKKEAVFAELNSILDRIPQMLQEHRTSRMDGADTGICDGISVVAKEMAIEAFRDDAKLRKALGKIVAEHLHEYFKAYMDDSAPKK